MSRRLLNILLLSKTISDVGSALDFIALNMLVWMRTESPWAMGCLVGGFYLGGVVGGHALSRGEGRWTRRQLMIAADVLRGAAVLLLAALPADGQLVWIYPTIVIIGVGRAVFEAALAAELPNVAGPRLPSYNSSFTALRGVALVIGMLGAAVAIEQVGFRVLFLIDAMTYLLSALVLRYGLVFGMARACTSAGAEGVTAVAVPPAVAAAAVPSAMAVYSLRAIWATVVGCGLAGVVVLRGLDAFGSGTHHVGLPMLGAALSPADPARAYGLLWGIWATGLVMASVVIRPRFRRAFDSMAGESPARTAPARRIFFAATAGMSLGFIGLFWLPGWSWKIAAAFVAGMGDGLSEIGFRHLLQHAPDARRGAVFGAAEMVKNGGLILGIFFTGAVATSASMSWWVLLLHGLPLCAATAGLILTQCPRSEVRSNPARPRDHIISH